jgi:hypothetical protein
VEVEYLTNYWTSNRIVFACEWPPSGQLRYWRLPFFMLWMGKILFVKKIPQISCPWNIIVL